MPAIWSSSESPICVRMVWVDGIRHAILSEDDPLLRRRPQSTIGIKKKNSFASVSPRDVGCFDACLVKLRLVTEKKSVSDRGESARTLRRQSAPICSRLARRESDSVSLLLGNYKDSYECVSRSTDALEIKEITFRLDKESTPQDTPALIHLDTLSERVLQWLDLSGRVDLVPDTSEIENFCMDDGKNNQRIKYNRLDEEYNGTCMKMIVPTKYLILQEDQENDSIDDDSIEDKVFYKRKVLKSSAAKEIQNCDESESSRVEKSQKITPKSEGGTSGKLWSPPAKPQLHIFMPSLKSTDIQWLSSSQESLFFE